MPGFALQPIARSTPVRRQRTAPDERSDMREHANESRITDVSRLRSHRCTIIASTGSNEHSWARRVVLPGLDMGHKSEIRYILAALSDTGGISSQVERIFSRRRSSIETQVC